MIHKVVDIDVRWSTGLSSGLVLAVQHPSKVRTRKVIQEFLDEYYEGDVRSFRIVSRHTFPLGDRSTSVVIVKD
jgi:hypothetical protein